MNERTVLVVEALGHWVLAWTLVVLAVASWIGAARPRRAAVRYGGWLLATFAGLALAPIVLSVGPLANWREVFRVLVIERSAPDSSESSAAFRSWFDGETSPFRPESALIRPEDAIDRGDTGPTPEPARSVALARTASDPPRRSVRWLFLAAGVWVAGFSLFAARLVWSARRIRALLAGAETNGPPELRSELEAARRELGIRRRVRIAVHPGIAAPMCVGLLRPVILWPSPENCPMSPRERLASLTHELAHLHHGDDLVALLAEVWRALAWFYPPVHLTVARLRKEREYRCDDLGAAKLDTPEQYARWLLDLAPIRVEPPAPLLAASLLGGTSLADRVRRILRGETRWAGPMRRRARVLLALAAILMLGTAGSVRLVGFAGRAAAAEPANDPLPEITPAQLAAKIREAMARYNDRGSFRVVFTTTQDTNWDPNKQPIVVSYRGRARYESDGTRWRAEYEGMSPTLGTIRMWPDRWSTGFDGVQEYHWEVSKNHFILGQSAHFANQWGSRHVVWEDTDHLLQMLEKPEELKNALAITQRAVDGMRCYVVENHSPDGQWGGEVIISPRQGYLPISEQRTRRGKVYHSYRLHGVHEVVAGIWAPDRIEKESISVYDDRPSRLSMRYRIQVVEYRPGQSPPAAAFRPEIPYGVDVTDRRQGWSYQNDPWWPEIGAMLREKYHWPPPDFSPLGQLQSSTEKKLDGAAAPPLRVATWLNSGPVDLAALRGKVVLLEYWNIIDTFRRPVVPALNQLYAKYHAAGLEIVSIHPPTHDTDRLRRFLREYGIEFPVAVDAAGPPPWGATADAYGTRDATYAFLIDREGKIHSVRPSMGNGGPGVGTEGGGNVVETIVLLLKQAGARGVEAVSLEVPRLPGQADRDVEAMFPKLARAALNASPQGRIVGRIVDEHGRPIAGAGVRATLRFTMLMSTQPGGYYLVPYRAGEERFVATTGADGRFELSGLCKGAYGVKVEARGRAWKERTAYLAPDLKPASVEFVLDQGDAIAGQVRDPQGKPIAGATVAATERQHYVDGELRYMTSPGRDDVKTDEAGRFRFAGLQEGRYVFEIKAAGYKDRVLEPIPAGKEDFAVTLEHSP
jgi:beta-lactamase regulating signal transducer with metallopeptidase domain